MSVTREVIEGRLYRGVVCDICGLHHHHLCATYWRDIHDEALRDGWGTYGKDSETGARHICTVCIAKGRGIPEGSE